MAADPAYCLTVLRRPSVKRTMAASLWRAQVAACKAALAAQRGRQGGAKANRAHGVGHSTEAWRPPRAALEWPPLAFCVQPRARSQPRSRYRHDVATTRFEPKPEPQCPTCHGGGDVLRQGRPGKFYDPNLKPDQWRIETCPTCNGTAEAPGASTATNSAPSQGA
jgi:hypothetical protein